MKPGTLYKFPPENSPPTFFEGMPFAYGKIIFLGIEDAIMLLNLITETASTVVVFLHKSEIVWDRIHVPPEHYFSRFRKVEF